MEENLSAKKSFSFLSIYEKNAVPVLGKNIWRGLAPHFLGSNNG